MEDSAITNFNLELVQEPVTPEVEPTASNPGKANGVQTGDVLLSTSVLLILVACTISVVMHFKMRKASRVKKLIKNNFMSKHVKEGGNNEFI